METIKEFKKTKGEAEEQIAEMLMNFANKYELDVEDITISCEKAYVYQGDLLFSTTFRVKINVNL